jgi:hypothetical protein
VNDDGHILGHLGENDTIEAKLWLGDIADDELDLSSGPDGRYLVRHRGLQLSLRSLNGPADENINFVRVNLQRQLEKKTSAQSASASGEEYCLAPEE